MLKNNETKNFADLGSRNFKSLYLKITKLKRQVPPSSTFFWNSKIMIPWNSEKKKSLISLIIIRGLFWEFRRFSEHFQQNCLEFIIWMFLQIPNHLTKNKYYRSILCYISRIAVPPNIRYYDGNFVFKTIFWNFLLEVNCPTKNVLLKVLILALYILWWFL